MHIYLPEPSFQGNRLFVPSQEQTDKTKLENKKNNQSPFPDKHIYTNYKKSILAPDRSFQSLCYYPL